MEGMTYLNKFKGIVEVKIRIMNFSLKFITTTKPIMKCYSKKMNAWFLIYALLRAKLTLLLIAWKLFWFVICVCYVSIWMFIVFFIFLVFDMFLSKRFYVLCSFYFNMFPGWTSVFESTWLVLFWVRY
jgi:hypothetical protein